MKEEIKNTGKTLIQELIISLMTEGSKELTPFFKKFVGKVSKDKKDREIKYAQIKQVCTSGSKLSELEDSRIESHIIVQHLWNEHNSLESLNPMNYLKRNFITQEIKKWNTLIADFKSTRNNKIDHELRKMFNSKNESNFFDGYPDIISEALSIETRTQLNNFILAFKKDFERNNSFSLADVTFPEGLTTGLPKSLGW